MSDTIGIKPLMVQLGLDQMKTQSQTVNDGAAALEETQAAQNKEGYTADEYAQQHLRITQTITALNTLMDTKIAHITQTSETLQGL